MPFKFTHWPCEHWGHITQRFGANRQYYGRFGPKNLKLRGHDGIDFYAPKGSRIFAVAPGVVSDVNLTGLKPSGLMHSYGIFLRIDHDNGYQTTYAHLQTVLVNKGDHVLGGQLIGLADNTGNIKSGDSHLHLTLKRFPFGDRGWPYNIADPTPFIMELLAKGQESDPIVAAVIGKLEDTAPFRNRPGYVTYYDDQRWALDDNLDWIDTIIDQGYPILVVGDPRQADGVFLEELRRIFGDLDLQKEDKKPPKRRRRGKHGPL